MSINDDSSFEEIGHSDLDSVGDRNDVDGNHDQSKVVVELPSSFLTSNKSGSDGAGAKKHPGPQAGEENSDSTSSFVPVKAIKTLKLDEDSFASYTFVGSNNSVAASSTISGFDLISLSDAVKRRCQRCTFVNADRDGICCGCGFVLLANPCIDVDYQIAIHLQQKEEQYAHAQLKTLEGKRARLSEEHILVQASAFVRELTSYVATATDLNRADDRAAGFVTLPSPSLTDLTSRFIDFVKENHSRVVLSIGYHFVDKFRSDPACLRQNEYGGGSSFASSPYMVSRLPGLFSIPEKSEAKTESKSSHHVGWIAIVAHFYTSDSDVFDSKDRTVTVHDTVQALPLVSFDASLRKNDSVQRMEHSLLQICKDFFLCDLSLPLLFTIDASEPRDCPTPTKKFKSDELDKSEKNCKLEGENAHEDAEAMEDTAECADLEVAPVSDKEETTADVGSIDFELVEKAMVESAHAKDQDHVDSAEDSEVKASMNPSQVGQVDGSNLEQPDSFGQDDEDEGDESFFRA
jgi:hypothetical protein